MIKPCPCNTIVRGQLKGEGQKGKLKVRSRSGQVKRLNIRKSLESQVWVMVLDVHRKAASC